MLNAQALRPPLTGVGHYTYHLLEEFLSSADVETIDCFTGTHWVSGQEQMSTSQLHRRTASEGTADGLAGAIATVRQLVGKVPGVKAGYDSVMARRFASRAGEAPGTIYHETNYILQPARCPTVTTVHDLSHVHYPQFHPPHVVTYLNRYLPDSIEKADAIITPSALVRDEVIEHFSLDPARVHAIYEGVDPAYRPRSQAESEKALEAFGLRYQGFVLMVATLEPRKGIDVLLDAWDRLPIALRQQFPLVLAGSSGWRNEAMLARVARMQAEGTVKRLGYVSSEVLPLLFSSAAVFTYPSVYEGFGLPVLDAMRSAAPVICRAGTSMAEFAEGSCLLCEGGSAEELSAHLLTLLEDPQLRERWGQRGFEQSQKFSWARCARETVEVYQQLLAR